MNIHLQSIYSKHSLRPFSIHMITNRMILPGKHNCYDYARCARIHLTLSGPVLVYCFVELSSWIIHLLVVAKHNTYE